MFKNKKFRIILSIVLSVFIVSAVVVSVVLVTNKKSKNNDENSYVTVSFETNGGSSVESMSIKRGETIDNLPQTYLAGSSFIGWFLDESLSESFFSETIVDKDTTLYAGFVTSDNDLVETEQTEYYEDSCDAKMVVQFVSTGSYSEEEFLNALSVEAISGELPSGFTITKDGNIYSLTATNGYSAGKLYKITVPKDIRFKDLSEDVNEFTFRIDKEDSTTVELKNDIHYVATSDLHAYSASDNGYQLAFRIKTDEIDEFFNFKINDIICLGPTREYDYENSIFMKISEIIKNNQNETVQKVDKSTNNVTFEVVNYTYLYLATVDADVEDIYSLVDVKFDDVIPTSSIIDQLDVEELTNSVYSSGAFDKVTTMVATLLSESDTILTALANSETSQSTSNGPDFTKNAYIKDGTLKNMIKMKIADGAKVSIGIGEGYNPNFLSNYSENFVVLNATFTYDATIKKKVKIKVQFTLTEYVAVTMQGCLDYSIVGDKWLYFDYALNIYSQTDIDMSILFCSADDDEYRDISQEIKDKLSKDNEEDPNNLVQQLQDMLGSESGDIELFRTNILHIDYKIIPICPIMQVNIDFDFLVKMNFAAGLATDISILEATQIGVAGDTRENYIKSYKHDLYGGNRYCVELTACGYVGIKAGFEGSLTVSFCGLSRLGKVGVFVFVGPYVDLYGFAQLTLVKDNGRAIASLVGGYYIEVGINLEITLEARSDLFKVKVGVTLIDEKWPLVSFGNKEVLLSMDGSDLDDVFIAGVAEGLEIEENNTATVSLNTLSPLKGRYIDITTGKISTKDISWDNIYLTFSNRKFTLDFNSKIITYSNGDIPRPASEECTVYYYFTGPCLQFNLSATQSQNYYKFGTSRIVYYDKSIVNEEAAGQTFTANVYTELDGVRTLVDSYKVLAGSRLRFIETGIDTYQYMDISWNKVPKDTYIVEDTDFIQYGYSRQAFVAFIYYEEGTDYDDPGTWYTEIRAVDFGKKPSVPTLPADGVKTKFIEWKATTNGTDFIGNEIVAVPTVEDLRASKRISSLKYTHGQDTTTYYFRYKNESSRMVLLELSNRYYNDLAMWSYVVENVYLACYEEQTCVLTTITDIDDNVWADGCYDTDKYPLEYGSKLNSFYTLTEMKYRFKGASLTKGGEIAYENLLDVPKLYKDLTLYMVYEPIVHTVVLQYYNDITKQFIDYKEYKIGRSWKLGRLDIDYDGASDKLIKSDGVEYTLLSWQYRYEGQEYKDYATDDAQIFRDIEIYPVYRRKVSLTLSTGSDSIWATTTTTGYYTDSAYDYTTYVGNLCYKEPDLYYTYNHTGWKNKTTGEIFPIDKVYCDTPATFEPVFTPVSIVYTLTIETTKGVLENGETSLELKCDYDDYLKKVEYYAVTWHPEDVHVADEHCYYTSDGISQFLDNNNIIYLIKYDLWKKVLYTHTVKIDKNGGEVLFATSEETGDPIYSYENQISYGKNFYLTNIFATKVTDLATYKLVGWLDEDGNSYATDASYVVLKDTTFKPDWELVSYFEYTITYYLNDEKYDEKTYHFEDEINLAQPKETQGLAYDGWNVYYSDDLSTKINGITKMPNKNLVAKAYSKEVFVYYYVDGNEISKTHGDVGVRYEVNSNYSRKGYSVTQWQTDDVSISNNGFTMPKTDVVFNATTLINSYRVTYNHSGSIYNQKTMEYGTFTMLIDVPAGESGVTYVWNSEDVSLFGNGFIVPDHDVSIESVQIEKTALIVYYVGDAVYDCTVAKTGENVTLISKPNGVENWYIENNVATSLVMPDHDIFVYSEIKDKKFTITFDISSGLDYDYSSGNYGEIKATTGGKYYLPVVPVISSDMTNYTTDGWYSVDAEILSDNGGNYIIMPEHNVTIHAFAYPDNTGGKKATTYLVLDSVIEFLEYNIVEDITVYFKYPSVDGYQFVYWLDSDGNKYNSTRGVTIDDMNGEDREFYAIYRKIGLHVATFVVDGEIVGYDVFYDYNFVQLNIPTVTSENGEIYSDWINPYVTLMGSFLFLSDESLFGKDFVFQRFSCETGSVRVQVKYKGDILATVYVEEKQSIKLYASYLDAEISYGIKAYGSLEGYDTPIEFSTCNATIVKENDYYLITLPNISELNNNASTLDFSYFEILLVLS